MFNGIKYQFVNIFHSELKIAINDVTMANDCHFQNSILHCNTSPFCKMYMGRRGTSGEFMFT